MVRKKTRFPCRRIIGFLTLKLLACTLKRLTVSKYALRLDIVKAECGPRQSHHLHHEIPLLVCLEGNLALQVPHDPVLALSEQLSFRNQWRDHRPHLQLEVLALCRVQAHCRQGVSQGGALAPCLYQIRTESHLVVAMEEEYSGWLRIIRVAGRQS